MFVESLRGQALAGLDQQQGTALLTPDPAEPAAEQGDRSRLQQASLQRQGPLRGDQPVRISVLRRKQR